MFFPLLSSSVFFPSLFHSSVQPLFPHEISMNSKKQPELSSAPFALVKMVVISLSQLMDTQIRDCARENI